MSAIQQYHCCICRANYVLQAIDKQWDDVAQYNVSIPDVNIPFGATFPVKLRLAPLSKRIKLQALTIDVLEQHELRIKAPASYSAQFNVHFLSSKQEHVIFSERHNLDGCISPESEESDLEWCITKAISLPQDLEACTQDVSSNTITIKHHVAFTVELLGVGEGLSMVSEIDCLYTTEKHNCPTSRTVYADAYIDKRNYSI